MGTGSGVASRQVAVKGGGGRIAGEVDGAWEGQSGGSGLWFEEELGGALPLGGAHVAAGPAHAVPEKEQGFGEKVSVFACHGREIEAAGGGR